MANSRFTRRPLNLPATISTKLMILKRLIPQFLLNEKTGFPKKQGGSRGVRGNFMTYITAFAQTLPDLPTEVSNTQFELLWRNNWVVPWHLSCSIFFDAWPGIRLAKVNESTLTAAPVCIFLITVLKHNPEITYLLTMHLHSVKAIWGNNFKQLFP